MMSLTREIGHHNWKEKRERLVGQFRYVARGDPRKRAQTARKGIDDSTTRQKGGRRARCRLRATTVFSANASRQSDFGFPFLGGFSERKRQRTKEPSNTRTSFSLSTASNAARPVLVDPGRPSPLAPLVLPLGWPNNRLNIMARFFWGIL